MTSMDVHDPGLGVMVSRLADRQIPAPLMVNRDDEQIAVIVRSQAYSPRLHHFRQNEEGWLTCHACPEPTVIISRPLNLADALDWANQHWADNHREAK